MWRSLHFVFAMLIPVFVVLMVGCIRAKEEKADLGPEASEMDIAQALGKATAGPDLSSLRVGQFAHYDYTRRLENEEIVQNQGTLAVSVFNVTQVGNYNRFGMKIDKSIRLPDNSWEETHKQYDVDVPITPSVSSAQFIGLNLKALGTVTAQGKDPTKVTYHRLRTSEDTIDAPAAVKARADCGGLSPCQIPVNYVQFDLVQWYADDSYQKIAIDFAFSAQTPYLPFGSGLVNTHTGILVALCQGVLVPVQGRTVYVRDCMNLQDFQK